MTPCSPGFLEGKFECCYGNSWAISNPEDDAMKVCTQYASKFGKLSSGHRTGKGQVSFQYHTIALISHANKVMLKILQARLQQYVNQEPPDLQTGFRKGRGTRDQISDIHWLFLNSEIRASGCAWWFIFFSFSYLSLATHGTQDLSSPTRNEPVPPAVEVQSLNHWTTRKDLWQFLLKNIFYQTQMRDNIQ